MDGGGCKKCTVDVGWSRVDSESVSCVYVSNWVHMKKHGKSWLSSLGWYFIFAIFACFINTHTHSDRLIEHETVCARSGRQLNKQKRTKEKESERKKYISKIKSRSRCVFARHFFIYFFYFLRYLFLTWLLVFDDGEWIFIYVWEYFFHFSAVLRLTSFPFFACFFFFRCWSSVLALLVLSRFGSWLLCLFYYSRIVHFELNRGFFFRASKRKMFSRSIWNRSKVDDNDYDMCVCVCVRERVLDLISQFTTSANDSDFHATSIYGMAVVGFCSVLFLFYLSSQTFQSGKFVWSNLCCCC